MWTFLFFCAATLATFAPDTVIGKALRRIMIDIPAEKLNRVSAPVLGFWFLVALAVVGVVELMGMEGVQLSALTLPEFIAWFLAFDVATYIDVVAVLWTLAALASARTLYRMATSAVRKSGRRLAVRTRARRIKAARTRRTHTRPKPRPTASSDGDERGSRQTKARRALAPVRGRVSGRSYDQLRRPRLAAVERLRARG